uniref:hypothetical protein n=1 Tax=uncultured Fibrobacter sp. TaxID=261512 RepID=UPI0028058178
AAFLVEKLHDGMDAIRRFFLEPVPYYGKKAVKGFWDAVKSKGEMLLEWYRKNKVAIELFAKTVIKAAYAAITIALAVAAGLALTVATGGAGTVFAVPIFIACVPDRTLSGLPSLRPAAWFS